MFSNTLSLLSSRNVNDQVSRTLPFLILNRDVDSVLFEMILRKLNKERVVYIRSPNLQFKVNLNFAHYGILLFLRSNLH